MTMTHETIDWPFEIATRAKMSYSAALRLFDVEDWLDAFESAHSSEEPIREGSFTNYPTGIKAVAPDADLDAFLGFWGFCLIDDDVCWWTEDGEDSRVRSEAAFVIRQYSRALCRVASRGWRPLRNNDWLQEKILCNALRRAEPAGCAVPREQIAEWQWVAPDLIEYSTRGKRTLSVKLDEFDGVVDVWGEGADPEEVTK